MKIYKLKPNDLKYVHNEYNYSLMVARIIFLRYLYVYHKNYKTVRNHLNIDILHRDVRVLVYALTGIQIENNNLLEKFENGTNASFYINDRDISCEFTEVYKGRKNYSEYDDVIRLLKGEIKLMRKYVRNVDVTKYGDMLLKRNGYL